MLAIADSDTRSTAGAALMEPYVRFLGAFEEAVPDTAWALAQEKLSAYLGLAAAAQTSPVAAADLHRAYAEYVEAAVAPLRGEHVARLIDEAYRRYLGELSAAWSAIDVAALDPVSLANAAEAALGVAWLRYAATLVEAPAETGQVQSSPDHSGPPS